ncbi:4'-phosphopantetheinyl transferase superfamily protein [Blattabacterium cuenoti]|uniref:4'-phosphopantetheinyl transferase superfamily protein n=1 Tax=Blattabacterium cuenoti TaxID=1653831 RepID=UPI001EEC25D4|nr:4'-phosphopantetheinyl transferase superfamily protein [Blattabacterium cuenoti]
MSHSFERIAIAISYYHIGIDIEKLRKDKKIFKIKKKFIREDESFFIHSSYEEDYLYIIWGIKESLYKLDGGLSYNFLDHYKVSPFCIKKDYCISCWIIKESYSKKFSAFYRKIEEHYLVYIIDNE